MVEIGENFKYEDVNYSVLDHKSCQVGRGLDYFPFNSAVPRDYLKSIIIPPFIEYKCVKLTVTVISIYAFYYCKNITSIFLPFTIEKIETNAFGGMYSLIELPTLHLNKLRYIGSGAIHSCPKLETFFIPSSVKYIH